MKNPRLLSSRVNETCITIATILKKTIIYQFRFSNDIRRSLIRNLRTIQRNLNKRRSLTKNKEKNYQALSNTTLSIAILQTTLTRFTNTILARF